MCLDARRVRVRAQHREGHLSDPRTQGTTLVERVHSNVQSKSNQLWVESWEIKEPTSVYDRGGNNIGTYKVCDTSESQNCNIVLKCGEVDGKTMANIKIESDVMKHAWENTQRLSNDSPLPRFPHILQPAREKKSDEDNPYVVYEGREDTTHKHILCIATEYATFGTLDAYIRYMKEEKGLSLDVERVKNMVAVQVLISLHAFGDVWHGDLMDNIFMDSLRPTWSKGDWFYRLQDGDGTVCIVIPHDLIGSFGFARIGDFGASYSSSVEGSVENLERRFDKEKGQPDKTTYSNSDLDALTSALAKFKIIRQGPPPPTPRPKRPKEKSQAQQEGFPPPFNIRFLEEKATLVQMSTPSWGKKAALAQMKTPSSSHNPDESYYEYVLDHDHPTIVDLIRKHGSFESFRSPCENYDPSKHVIVFGDSAQTNAGKKSDGAAAEGS